MFFSRGVLILDVCCCSCPLEFCILYWTPGGVAAAALPANMDPNKNNQSYNQGVLEEYTQNGLKRLGWRLGNNGRLVGEW